MSDIDVDNAKLDPTEYFEDPDEVMQADISDDDKVTIFKQWEYDLRELLVAEEENMPADDDGESLHEKLQRVRGCLYKLEAIEDNESNSKQGSN